MCRVVSNPDLPFEGMGNLFAVCPMDPASGRRLQITPASNTLASHNLKPYLRL